MKGQTIKHKGKGSQEEMLPSRHAMSQLTTGDSVQRSLNNYSKKTPGGLDQGAPGLFGMGMGSNFS